MHPAAAKARWWLSSGYCQFVPVNVKVNLFLDKTPNMFGNLEEPPEIRCKDETSVRNAKCQVRVRTAVDQWEHDYDLGEAGAKGSSC